MKISNIIYNLDIKLSDRIPINIWTDVFRNAGRLNFNLNVFWPKLEDDRLKLISLEEVGY